MSDQTINVTVSDLSNITVEVQEIVNILEIAEVETATLELIDYEPIILDCVEEVTIVDMAPETIYVELYECASILNASGSGGGFVFVTDVTASGIVANKVYTPATIPANSVLEECVTDTELVEIHFIAEGGSNYSPTVEVDGIPCTNLEEIAGDRRLFSGSVTVTVLTTSTLDVVSSSGQSTTITINKSGAGPQVLTCVIGDLPGTQTAGKAGDVVHVTGTVEAEATEVRILNYGISGLGTWQSVVAGTFDITVNLSSRTGTHHARVEARNSIGTTGNTFNSTNTILLDQTAPVFVDGGTAFPIGQQAFKSFENGIQTTIVSDFSSLHYTSPNGDFVITNDTTYEENKEIICTNPGTYNDSNTNFRIVAHKESNDTNSTFNKAIEVADTAPVITISQPQTRLRSSPLGTDYSISLTSDQNLPVSPKIDIPVGGTWQGSDFQGSGKNWSRDIRITDTDAKGSGPWTLASPFVNNAGIEGTITGIQVNGGFMPRDLVLDAFQNEISVDVEVTDFSKISIGIWEFTGATLNRSTINDNPPVPGYFTINAIGISPHVFRVLDTNQTNASSQATLIYDYEESV